LSGRFGLHHVQFAADFPANEAQRGDVAVQFSFDVVFSEPGFIGRSDFLSFK